MVRAPNYDALSGQKKDSKAILLPITFYLMQYSSRDQTRYLPTGSKWLNFNIGLSG